LVKRAALIFFALLPLFAAAQLPMLLDRGQAQVIGVPPNPAFVGYFNYPANFYGDSMTAGYLLNSPTNRFSSLLSAQYYLAESNYGIGGSQIIDAGESDNITANNSISNNTVSVWLAGYNDMRYYGTDSAALTDNFAALESLAAWLAIPTELRVPWNSTANFPAPGNIYYSPGWIFLPSALGGLAASTQPGALAGFYFSGSTLLVGTGRGGGAGTGTLVVGDYVNNVFTPTLTNNFSCLRTAANTGAGRSYSAALIIITNLSSTTNHGAIFTADSAANTYFCWYASYSTNLLPKVVLSGTLKMAPQGVGLDAPNNHASDAAAALYSGVVSNAATVLAAAKLNVQYVAPPVLLTNTDWEIPDWIHPNESGHLKIKNAIQAAF
jgi:hypothetical protein